MCMQMEETRLARTGAAPQKPTFGSGVFSNYLHVQAILPRMLYLSTHQWKFLC
jgi:hypothetical protein